jgi:hypothetical protein
VKDIRYIRLDGLSCGVCGWPTLGIALPLNGVVRTVHKYRDQPCYSARPSTSNEQDKRGATETRDRAPSSASVSSRAVAARRAA